MTRQDLTFCRKTALALASIRGRISELRACACSTSGIGYDGKPKVRGEPISAQQRYVEKLEKLEREAFRLEQMQKAHWGELPTGTLTRLQRQLIYGYYFQGLEWEEANRKCGVNRQKSLYEVRKALKKIGKSP